MDSTPFVCIRCAASGPTCCTTSPAGDNCFPLSAAEEKRLAPYAADLGLVSHAVADNTPEFLKLMEALFPDKRKEVRENYPENGTHLRLPLKENGDCLFLQVAGCALPRVARPWYCQLFPLWVRNGFFDRFIPEACLLTHEAKRLGELFAALEITRDEARNLYKALCRDWGLEKNDKRD